jgi:outer membrane murein-binding lipoprotein Lpp
MCALLASAIVGTATVTAAPAAVTISDFQGDACFIGDDAVYHPAVIDASKLSNVMFCQAKEKDNATPVSKPPAKYLLHGAGNDHTGAGVRISTGGKYCRLAYHHRNGNGDGRYRILCDQASEGGAEKFNIAALGNGQFSLQDSTGSFCEMGWGIRCRFRRSVTSGGKFKIAAYRATTTTAAGTTTEPCSSQEAIAAAQKASLEKLDQTFSRVQRDLNEMVAQMKSADVEAAQLEAQAAKLDALLKAKSCL